MSNDALKALIPSASEYCVLRSDVVDRLLSCGDGDGALLYLYIVRHGVPDDESAVLRALNFSQSRLERAAFTLGNLKISSNAVQNRQNGAPRPPVPRYTVSELRTRRTDDRRFESVCQTAESVLGRTLTEGQLRTLYTAYDHLGLPADVIIDMLVWLKREKGVPSRKDIEGTAYLWADMGIYTAEASSAFLSRLESRKPVMEEMLRALDMAGRDPSPNEYRYLERFINQGFTPEAVELGKERLYGRLTRFSWQYLRGILDNWHERGAHTVEEITAIEPNLAQKPKNDNAAPNAPARQDKLEDWEKDWLDQYKEMVQTMEEQ